MIINLFLQFKCMHINVDADRADDIVDFNCMDNREENDIPSNSGGLINSPSNCAYKFYKF